MVLDAEAMHLVADALEKALGRRSLRDRQRGRSPGDEDLLFALRERRQGEPPDSRLPHGLCRRGELSLSPVDQKQVREIDEATAQVAKMMDVDLEDIKKAAGK